jgi:hypothetical protein
MTTYKVMALADYIKAAGKHLNAMHRHARRIPVWVRFTSLVLAVSMTGSVALGIPLHSSERGCNTPMQKPDCEHMGMEPSAPGVTTAVLCCLLDCQEPGLTGSTFNQRKPSFSVGFLNHAALTPPASLPRPFSQRKWLQSSSFTPPDTYLKNLALLI